MRQLFGSIDRLLRGQYTRREDLASGSLPVPARTLVVAGLVLGGAYGLFMGLYGALRPENRSVAQLVATTAKVPLLFLLTLSVTFPSLYVFSALANSRLRAKETLRLLLAAVAVNLALLASLGPVTGFFTLSTESYPFMVTLNVAFFAVSGFVGLSFLRRMLDRVFEAPSAPPPPVPWTAGPEPEEPGASAAEPRLATLPDMPTFEPPSARREPPPARRPSEAGRAPRRVFAVWILIYAVVGAQMGWILRPFVGTPDRPFELFRERESNFFESFLRTLGRLFG